MTNGLVFFSFVTRAKSFFKLQSRGKHRSPDSNIFGWLHSHRRGCLISPSHCEIQIDLFRFLPHILWTVSYGEFVSVLSAWLIKLIDLMSLHLRIWLFCYVNNGQFQLYLRYLSIIIYVIEQIFQCYLRLLFILRMVLVFLLYSAVSSHVRFHLLILNVHFLFPLLQ